MRWRGGCFWLHSSVLRFSLHHSTFTFSRGNFSCDDKPKPCIRLMAFPLAGWFLIGSCWRRFISLFYHPDEKAVLRLLRLWHLRLLGRSAPNIYDEEATVSIMTGFLLCCIILMDVPSPWVRVPVRMYLLHYSNTSIWLSSHFGGFLRHLRSDEEAPILLSETKKLPVALGFVFSSLWSCECNFFSISFVFHAWVKSSLVSVFSYYSSLRSPGNIYMMLCTRILYWLIYNGVSRRPLTKFIIFLFWSFSSQIPLRPSEN